MAAEVRPPGDRRNAARPDLKSRRASLPGLAALGLALLAWAPALAQDDAIEVGDVIHGWRVFHEKHCVQCHAIWGQGAQIGPDLGRTQAGHQSTSDFVGRMWNHVPRMVALRRQYQLAEVTLTRREMADVFSFLYFVRHLDQPGEPRAGRRILEQKKCTACHALEHGDGQIGPDLTRWARFVNPIVWAQMMWEHGEGMERAMRQANIEWPVLGDADLADMIAYVRSVGTSEKKVYLQPGSPARGQQLFRERACAACHAPEPGDARRGPDLTRVPLPRSMSALASHMWNHQPAMRKVMAEQNVKLSPLTAQDMADLIAYLFALQYEGEPGQPQRGQQVFEQKRCVDCHTLSDAAPGPAERASAVGMGHAIWRHGAAMADRMAEAGIPWPTFEGTEMADLIAYLRSAGPVSPGLRSGGPRDSQASNGK